MYADLRAQSVISGGLPIAVRHIESVVRMSEAFAKMHLRDHVRDDDVDNAIKVKAFTASKPSMCLLEIYTLHLPYVLAGYARVVYSSAKDISSTIAAENLEEVHHIRRGEEQFAHARAAEVDQITTSISRGEILHFSSRIPC